MLCFRVDLLRLGSLGCVCWCAVLKTYFVICAKGEPPPAGLPRIDYGSLPDAGHAAGHDDHSHDQKKGPEEIAKLEPLPAPQAVRSLLYALLGIAVTFSLIRCDPFSSPLIDH